MSVFHIMVLIYFRLLSEGQGEGRGTIKTTCIFIQVDLLLSVYAELQIDLIRIIFYKINTHT